MTIVSFSARARETSRRLGREHGYRAHLVVVETVENPATMGVTQTGTAYPVYLRDVRRKDEEPVRGVAVRSSGWELLLAASELPAEVVEDMLRLDYDLRVISPADDLFVDSASPEQLATAGSPVVFPREGRETGGEPIVFRLRRVGGAYAHEVDYRGVGDGNLRGTGDGNVRVA